MIGTKSATLSESIRHFADVCGESWASDLAENVAICEEWDSLADDTEQRAAEGGVYDPHELRLRVEGTIGKRPRQRYAISTLPGGLGLRVSFGSHQLRCDPHTDSGFFNVGEIEGHNRSTAT